MPDLVTCTDDCGGFSVSDFQRANEIGRAFAIFCRLNSISSTVVDVGGDPAINVNIVGGAPIVGTSAFGGLNLTDASDVVPEGWSSFTVTNRADSTTFITVGTLELEPGISISHGSWDGFPGELIPVTVPDATTFAILSWVIPTVTT